MSDSAPVLAPTLAMAPNEKRRSIDERRRRNDDRLSVMHLSGWFAALIGLAYATGYLIVSTYLGSFGIEDVSGDLLRLKYLQVGFYFIIFSGSLVVLTTYLIRGLSQESNTTKSRARGDRRGSERPQAEAAARSANTMPHMTVLSIPMWMLVLIAIYLAIGFAEPNRTGRQSLPWVAGVVFLAFASSALLYSFRQRFSLRNPDYLLFNRIFYSALLIVIGALSWMVVQPFRQRLVDFFSFQWEVVLILVLYMATLVWLLYRTLFARPEFSGREHAQYMPMRAALGLPVYYLCVLTFAYGVYPFMSTSKAGGYYVDSELVKLTLRTASSRDVGESQRRTLSKSHDFVGPSKGLPSVGRAVTSSLPVELPPELMESETDSKPLVVIEKNSESIFVADPSDPKERGGAKCWTDFQCRPRVFELQIADLSRIEHIPFSK